MKRILVTGANGYIGRHVVTELLNQGFDVIACDVKTAEVDDRAQKINFDLFDLKNENIFLKLGSPDICIHMAWRNGFSHSSDSQMGDLSSHYLFLTKIIKDGLRHLSVMGTMHEVGYWEGPIDENTPCNPLSMYGIAKDSLRRSMMLFCKSESCVLQWMRCYYVLGDDRRNNSIFTKLLSAEEKGLTSFPFTSGRNKYDFLDVCDLSKLISLVVVQNKINGIINCCSGHPLSLAEKVEAFIKEHHLKISLDYGAFPDRPYDSPCVYGDITKISQILKNSRK